MKRLLWCLVCVLALGVASACDNGGNGDPDAGRDAGGGEEDSGPEPTPVVMATEGDTQVPADYSCSPAAPTASGDSTFTITAEDFLDGGPVEGLTVHFFADNMPSLDGTCTGTCQSVTTDSMGQATVMGSAGGWYAYRVLAGEGILAGTPSDYLGVVQVNEVTPADGGESGLNVVKVSSRQLILSLLGVSAEDNTIVVTGQATDCMGRPVSNAILRVFDSSGEVELGFTSSGPRAFYFNGSNIPLGAQRDTNTDGLYGAANVPIPGDNQVRVELWGTTTEGGSPEILGCENVQVSSVDALTIINMGPMRSDAPAGCSG